MTVTKPATIEEINLADPDFFVHGDPHAAFALLRQQSPVHKNPETKMFWGPAGKELAYQNFWSITKYDDIVRISRDPGSFISSPGIALQVDVDEMRRESGAPAEGQPDFEMDMRGRMLIMSDPPRHVKLRQLVNRGFTPRAAARLEEHIRRIATDIIQDLKPMDHCDFVVDAAAKLPLAVICEMLGIPKSDWQMMFDFSNRVLGSADPEYQQEGNFLNEMESFQYFMNMINDRRQQPNEDLVSTLVGSEIDGEKLEDIDIMLFIFLLVVAGNETTRNATSGGMWALIDNPEQREMVVKDRSLVTPAIEEILRWTNPVMHMTRHATKDVELRGQQIKEGDVVAMWYLSANRDEDVFDDPFTFNITRSPNEHVAFGIGQHFCLGANLARLELKVMFEELLERYPKMELTGQPERLRSNFIGGIKHMPVKLN